MGKHYVCDKHKTKGNTGKCQLCQPDHIADATKKVQPAPEPMPSCFGEPLAAMDESAEFCEDCHHLESCKQARAKSAVQRVKDRDAQSLLEWMSAPENQCLGLDHKDAATLLAHVSDLTRRLAEAEAEKDEEYAELVKVMAMLEQAEVEGKRWRTMVEDVVRISVLPVFLTTEPGRILHGLQDDLRKQLDGGRNSYDLMLEDKLALIARAEAAEARIADLEAQLSGVGVRQYREAVERLHKAEARVRELEAESMTFRTECINLETQRADLEAFKSRVMAWAQGACECCDNEPCEDEVDRPAACMACDNGSNWTPPQAWEVGE